MLPKHLIPKGINTPSIKRQRQSPIGMHCDAPTQASKLQSAAAADARCGHPLKKVHVKIATKFSKCI